MSATNSLRTCLSRTGDSNNPDHDDHGGDAGEHAADRIPALAACRRLGFVDTRRLGGLEAEDNDEADQPERKEPQNRIETLLGGDHAHDDRNNETNDKAHSLPPCHCWLNPAAAAKHQLAGVSSSAAPDCSKNGMSCIEIHRRGRLGGPGDTGRAYQGWPCRKEEIRAKP